ncbi:DUF3592 domain-containing protein [Streptomyces sp. NPDC017868]|uniref:DUF3592 domain-containing protein n=1 Tax=Streptomyces sp. NPDC017868 TaxID=3365014 RepID=UPI00378EB629
MTGEAWVVAAAMLGLGGTFAHLVGAMGLSRIHRLRRDGVTVPALVRYRTAAEEDAAHPRRPLLQFATLDGRVIEVVSPVPPSRTHALVDGSEVSITYDPADPSQILVDGRERRGLEYAFMGCGAALALSALALVLAAVRART